MANFLKFIHDGEVDVVNLDNINYLSTNKKTLIISIFYRDNSKGEIKCGNGANYDAIIKQIIDNL